RPAGDAPAAEGADRLAKREPAEPGELGAYFLEDRVGQARETDAHDRDAALAGLLREHHREPPGAREQPDGLVRVERRAFRAQRDPPGRNHHSSFSPRCCLIRLTSSRSSGNRLRWTSVRLCSWTGSAKYPSTLWSLGTSLLTPVFAPITARL